MVELSQCAVIMLADHWAKSFSLSVFAVVHVSSTQSEIWVSVSAVTCAEAEASLTCTFKHTLWKQVHASVGWAVVTQYVTVLIRSAQLCAAVFVLLCLPFKSSSVVFVFNETPTLNWTEPSITSCKRIVARPDERGSYLHLCVELLH